MSFETALKETSRKYSIVVRQKGENILQSRNVTNNGSAKSQLTMRTANSSLYTSTLTPEFPYGLKHEFCTARVNTRAAACPS